MKDFFVLLASVFHFILRLKIWAHWATLHLGEGNAQLCVRLWDLKAQTEVLILFPGSGNASGGQGLRERVNALCGQFRAEQC